MSEVRAGYPTSLKSGLRSMVIGYPTHVDIMRCGWAWGRLSYPVVGDIDKYRIVHMMGYPNHVKRVIIKIDQM